MADPGGIYKYVIVHFAAPRLHATAEVVHATLPSWNGLLAINSSSVLLLALESATNTAMATAG